jgi:CRP-like cAMP-binding protein
MIGRLSAHAKTRIAELRSARELASCSDQQLQSLLPYVDEVMLPGGRRVAVEGRLSSAFVIVAEGRLAAMSSRGQCRSLGPGDSFGWYAMWEHELNDATLVVESDARLLVIGRAQFRAVKAVMRRAASRNFSTAGPVL